MTYQDLTPAQQKILLRVASTNGRLARLANELREIADYTEDMIKSGRITSGFVNTGAARELSELASHREQLIYVIDRVGYDIPKNIVQDATKMDLNAFHIAHAKQ